MLMNFIRTSWSVSHTNYEMYLKQLHTNDKGQIPHYTHWPWPRTTYNTQYKPYTTTAWTKTNNSNKNFCLVPKNKQNDLNHICLRRLYDLAWTIHVYFVNETIMIRINVRRK